MQKVERVVAVVLNWRAYEDTVRAVVSLSASDYPELRTLIVDNASPDGSGDKLRRLFPTIEVIDAGTNRGYAGGNNLGIQRALELNADYVFILNPDAEVAPDCVTMLVETLRGAPDVAQVAAKVLHARDGSVGALGGEIRWSLAEPRQRGHLKPDDGEVATVEAVDFAPGTALMVRTSAIREVGLVPEEYFLYFEDVVWSLRFARSGWRVVVNPGARVVHRESSSTGMNSPLKSYYYARNNLYFLDEWSAPTDLAPRRRRLRMKLLRLGAKHLLRGRMRQALATAHGYLDYRAGSRGMTARGYH